MITMLHYDAVHSPDVGEKGKKQSSVLSQAQHLAYLEQHPYEAFSSQELEK